MDIYIVYFGNMYTLIISEPCLFMCIYTYACMHWYVYLQSTHICIFICIFICLYLGLYVLNASTYKYSRMFCTLFTPVPRLFLRVFENEPPVLFCIYPLKLRQKIVKKFQVLSIAFYAYIHRYIKIMYI
jgi:hypothetical protein